jgi:cyclic 2,3-diphosphoglycerate synthetase
VLLMGGGDGDAVRRLRDVSVIEVELRLRPLEPLEGRRIAVFTAGPASVDHLDADVAHVSRNLADRAALRQELAHIEADAFLVEIKAAAIDVVAEAALERGIECLFAANEVLPLGDEDLDAELISLAETAMAEAVAG